MGIEPTTDGLRGRCSTAELRVLVPPAGVARLAKGVAEAETRNLPRRNVGAAPRLSKLVPSEGFEPPTPSLERWCSIH